MKYLQNKTQITIEAIFTTQKYIWRKGKPLIKGED